MLNRHALFPVLAASVLVATGCTTSVTEAGDTRPAAAATEGVTKYPLSLENCGKSYTFTEAPQRVVVMNGGSVGEVSSLLALGVGDRVVANAQSYGNSDVPGRAAAIDALPTGGITPNSMQDIPREAMLSQHPDLVISTGGGGFAADQGFATRDELAAAGANTYVPRTNCGVTGAVTGTPTIEDSYAMLRDLGAVFDVPGRADRLIADSQRAIADTAARVSGEPKKNVLLVFAGMGMGGDDSDFSAIAAGGIWNDVLGKAGGVNPFERTDGTTFVTVSKEQLAATPIDGLVVVNYRSPDIDAVARRILAQFPQWPAAATGSYAVLADSIYLGPSNAVAVERIAKLVHPERFR
ncbi:ABC transporter substrate-binding protein [Nocardia brasiliensis]|uniref:ABC transporter substrate-binding protein n=1 Tax=Nocardia brasiliensis TaxID=37326 RepID=A0A6G9XXR0_NOCBR|nr:ABC transporter substrate-binding protein [Nocardia brasiliensis]QIS05704.1 ABC transporter substrate-binding protein [Nocardia brasiliensis]